MKKQTPMSETKNTKTSGLPAGVTPEQAKELARKHGAVYPVTVRKNKKAYVGLFKRPTLSILSAAAASAGDDAIRQGQVLYANCKLAVDPEVDQDEELLFGMITGVGSLFKVLAAEVGEPFVAEQ